MNFHPEEHHDEMHILQGRREITDSFVRPSEVIARDLLLTVGGKGSKIMVTTRYSSVSSIMGTTPPHNLECLSEDKSWSLFFRCAFGDEELDEQFPKLKGFGWQIVRKCRGIPLALKTLGSLLSSKTDESEWI